MHTKRLGIGDSGNLSSEIGPPPSWWSNLDEVKQKRQRCVLAMLVNTQPENVWRHFPSVWGAFDVEKSTHLHVAFSHLSTTPFRPFLYSLIIRLRLMTSLAKSFTAVQSLSYHNCKTQTSGDVVLLTVIWRDLTLILFTLYRQALLALIVPCNDSSQEDKSSVTHRIRGVFLQITK